MTKNLFDLRVAHVVNEHQVVLNAGADDGIEGGMSFILFADGPEITDPTTGKSLGLLEDVKGRVWVHHVAAQHCIAGDDRDESKTRAALNHGSRLSQLLGATGNSLLNVQINDRAKRVP